MNLKKIIVLLILVSFFVLVTGCGKGNIPVKLETSSNVDFNEDDYKKIVTSNNELGLELLSEIEADENGNTFISPTSLFMALSMVYNGADEVSKEEISKVLKSEGIEVNEMNKANASLMSILNSDSEEIQLNVANSIWLNETYHFQDNFAQNNRDYFNAQIQEIDIYDSKSVGMINDWVAESTNNKIGGIVKAPLNKDLVAILINAIYFKGNWKYEFDEKQTEKRPFYLEDGITKDVSLMTLDKKLAYMENENFQAVLLPYGDGEMSMKVFLPKENSTLAEFEKTLTNDNFKKWNSEFQQQEGTIMLPKFQLEYEVLLNEPLKKLGMTTAFEEGANFSKMIKEDDALWISQVKQKTFIDVNEEGTEAAAVTSLEMVQESAPAKSFHMEVNRPFFIAITDEETGTILFMGSIFDPIEGK
jgi:serine protease inhibitor